MLLVKYHENAIPAYAILSHTWEADDEKVIYKDFMENTEKRKAGWEKIEFCRKQAVVDQIQCFWIDTCCLDKTSSAELSKAIDCLS